MNDLIWVLSFVFIVAFTIGCAIIFYHNKNKSKQDVQDTWASRRTKANQFIQKFNGECSEKQFQADKTITTRVHYHTPSLQDIFSLRFDFKNKQLAMCSFESEEYKSFFINFDDIKSFEILNGIASSSSETYGDASTFAGITAASANTYTTNTMGNIRLKIETDDQYNPSNVVCICKFEVDTSSDTYKTLLDSIEEMKTFLNRIVKVNTEKN